jgi:hypothetical protein
MKGVPTKLLQSVGAKQPQKKAVDKQKKVGIKSISGSLGLKGKVISSSFDKTAGGLVGQAQSIQGSNLGSVIDNRNVANNRSNILNEQQLKLQQQINNGSIQPLQGQNNLYPKQTSFMQH